MIYLQEGHVVLPAGLGAPVQGSTPAKPKLQAKVTDSSTEIQTLLPDPGYDGLSSVMVLGVDRHIDSNIKPENIKSGVSILGVAGTLAFEPVLQQIDVTPTTDEQIHYAPEGVDGFDMVVVHGVDSTIDTNIQPENIKSGVSILGVDGTLVQEQIHNQDKEITANGTYTYDAGFTGLESVTVKVPGPVLSKVTITKNGTYTPDAGIDGFSSVDVEVPEVLPVIKALEITPSVEEQVHTVPEGADGFGPVTVHGVDSTIDTNIIPGNIKSGVSILGVAGTLVQTQIHNQDKTITTNGTYTHDAGFTGFGKITVDVPSSQPVLDALVVDPSTNEQTLTPSTGVDGFNQVTVHKVTSSIDTNITPENIKSGVSILGVQGSLQEGGSGEINVDAPIFTEFGTNTTGVYNVISPDVVKYVKRLVIYDSKTKKYSEQTVPADGKFSINSRYGLYAYWYFDFKQYNTDHDYTTYNYLDYKCLPENTFGNVDFSSGLTLKQIGLESINVIENNSLPAYGEIKLYDSIYYIKHIPEGVKLYIYKNINSSNEIYIKGFKNSNVYLYGNYIIRGYDKEYLIKDGALLKQFGNIKRVYNVFPFCPEVGLTGTKKHIIDIPENTSSWGDFGFNETGVTWVNDIDTFIIPSSCIGSSTFTFNDNITLNTIVSFKPYVGNDQINVVRESGTAQHNGTLFVPQNSQSRYESWLTALNTVGTWEIKIFRNVTTLPISGAVSGYYGYTDPNTGKHLFFSIK